MQTKSPYNQQYIEHYQSKGAWQQHTIYDYFIQQCQQDPNRLAVADAPNRNSVTSGQVTRLSYMQLSAQVDTLASSLQQFGIAQGDIVLVQLPNIAELIVLYLAVAKIGAIISPVAIQFRARELSNIIAKTQPKAYLSLRQIKGHNHIDYFLQNFANQCDIVLSFDEHTQTKLVSASTSKEKKKEQQKEQQSAPVTNKVDANSLFTICWTSGTEGAPKGVPRTHNNWRCSGIGVSEGYGIKQAETFLLPFPLINTAAIGGMLMPWLLHGGTLVLHHPFDTDVFIQQIIDENITVTLAAPALLNSILQKTEISELIKNSSLKYFGTGSAPPSAAMLREFDKRFNIQVINLFGSNEGVFLCSDKNIAPNPEERAKFFPRINHEFYNGINSSADWVTYKLVNPETRETIDKVGETGELMVKGPSIFAGYYDLGNYERSKFDQDGYFCTGDLFEITQDSDGLPRFYRVVGRKKDIIIRGGFNISPVELDEILTDLPEIEEVAVAAYEDQRLGEKICAYVVPKKGQQVTLDMLRKHLEKQGLAQFKWPERITIIDQLPRNALNKIVRRELQNYAAT